MKIFSQFTNSHGTYALIMRCNHTTQARAGSLGLLDVIPGWYIYIGSAFGPGGLQGRLKHHLDNERPSHWHVDVLKPLVHLHSIWFTTDTRRMECAWAEACQRLPGLSIPWPRFGASDCKCRAHLFYSRAKPEPGEFEVAVARLHPNGLPLVVIEL